MKCSNSESRNGVAGPVTFSLRVFVWVASFKSHSICTPHTCLFLLHFLRIFVFDSNMSKVCVVVCVSAAVRPFILCSVPCPQATTGPAVYHSSHQRVKPTALCPRRLSYKQKYAVES